MKTLLLTTDTPHHIFFVKEVAKSFEFSSIIVENNILLPNFDANHPFEDLIDDYEINNLKNLAGVISQHYSSPEGQEIDYNDEIIDILKHNNIKCCPTAIDGTNDLIIDSLFHLKRVMVF